MANSYLSDAHVGCVNRIRADSVQCTMLIERVDWTDSGRAAMLTWITVPGACLYFPFDLHYRPLRRVLVRRRMNTARTRRGQLSLTLLAMLVERCSRR